MVLGGLVRTSSLMGGRSSTPVNRGRSNGMRSPPCPTPRLSARCPQVVAVLNAALSEGGHLQMDGGAVATHTATFLLLASEATAFVVRNEGVEPLSERFDFRVRKHIEDAITAAASGQLGQVGRSLGGVRFLRLILPTDPKGGGA